MKYYKDDHGRVFAYEDGFNNVPKEYIEISEQEALELVQPPETPEQAIARLKAEIQGIEFRDLMNRRAREAFIVQAETIAAEQFGMTPEQLYLANPGYKGAKDIDNQIAQLRAQINALEDQL